MNTKQNEFEPDRICEESDGCPTEGSVLKRFWRSHQPDKGLCEFYEVVDYPSLVRELVGHVAQLQDAARRNVKPWEDTMPPTLLPARIERLKKADDEFRENLTESVDVIREMNDELVDLRVRLAEVTGFVQKLVSAAGNQPSVATGYMRDILDVIGNGASAESSAPVSMDAAKAFAKGFNTLESIGGKYKIVMQFAGHDDAWTAYTELSQMTSRLEKADRMNQ